MFIYFLDIFYFILNYIKLGVFLPIKFFIYIFLSILIVGCGTDNLKEDVVIEPEKVSFPQNLTINLPLKLEPNREMMTRYSTKSYTYEIMQSTIINYRDKSKLMALDLKLVESIFPSILEACRERFLKNNCTLPKETLTLDLSRPHLRAFKKAYAHLDFSWDVNNSLPLGEVNYREYKEGNVTEYYLNVDLLPVYNRLIGKAYREFYDGDYLIKHFQSLQWNTNSKRIELTSINDSNTSKNKLTLEYLTDNNQEIIQGYKESSSTSYGESHSHEMFTFMKLNDVNRSYIFRYNSAYHSESYKSIDYTHAKLSDSIGFHIKSSGNDNSQIIVFFDSSGKELGQYGCFEYNECSLSDTSSWSSGRESEENASILDKKFNVKLYNLKADSTTLKDGYYLILPKLFNKKEKIVKSSVGFIWVFKEKLYGALYDERYYKQLESLKIIQVIQEGSTQTTYREILQKDYPQLQIEREVSK